MNRTIAISLTLLFIFTSPISAQTEAEAISEVLVFQKKEGQQTVEVKVGDHVTIHQDADRKHDIMGNVVSVKENRLEIFTRKTGKKYIVDLQMVPGITARATKLNGTELMIVGLVLLTTGIGIIALVAGLFLYLSFTAAIFLAVLILTGLILLLVGWLKRKKRKPQILLKFWTWRLVRKKKVIYKKKAG